MARATTAIKRRNTSIGINWRQLTWISWDHNFVLGGTGDMDGGMAPPANLQNPANAGPMGGGRSSPNRSTSLDKADVGEAWPLIRYLLDDPTY